MRSAFLAKLRSLFPERARREGVSILLPFLIISIALGGLAWRSWYLSLKMERGSKTLASQYASYAAEITASRVDAAARGEMAHVADEWRQMDRRAIEPTSTSLRAWMAQHDWIVAAIYVPDADPTISTFIMEEHPHAGATRLASEFFTSTGTIRYTYDPQRLLNSLQSVTHQQPPLLPGDFRIRQPAEVSLVSSVPNVRLQATSDGFEFTAPLSAPMSAFGIQALVRTAWVGGSGWENQRVVSLWMAFVALGLTGIGAMLAIRGIRKEAETMKLRGELIANVSHELRTPLSMIRLGAETLKRGRLKDKERQDIEDQILREVLLLSHLVENVLDVARIQNRSTKALAFTPVSPLELVRNLVTTYESWIQSKGFSVTMTLDEHIGEQMWDRDAVSRAVLNLIDNAIKYSGDDRAIDVVLEQTDEHIVIAVKDHGIGIDTKDTTRIFDPYYRARFSDTSTRRGAGLGLTLVQQIVRSHGGEVQVESALGSGSTFRLLFPRILSREANDVAMLPQPSRAY